MSNIRNKEDFDAAIEEHNRAMVEEVIPAIERDLEQQRQDANALRLGLPRKKVSHVGAPAIFALEQCCRQINEAFTKGYGCYLVGSAIERPDWRDVDVRCILPDAEFATLFPDAGMNGTWEFDPRWTLLTVAISERMSKVTGLPVDFQFQPQTYANDKHKGARHALGLRFVSPRDGSATTLRDLGET